MMVLYVSCNDVLFVSAAAGGTGQLAVSTNTRVHVRGVEGGR